jgi:hypothetical protein
MTAGFAPVGRRRDHVPQSRRVSPFGAEALNQVLIEVVIVLQIEGRASNDGITRCYRFIGSLFSRDRRRTVFGSER